MKNLKSYIALLALAMIFCANNIIAQGNTKNDIPVSILTAFTAKYPKAEVKNWHIVSGVYTAKAKEDGRKFYAAFDQNGKWINTTSRIGLSRNLPTEVRNALRKSNYAAWRVDGIKKVETPTEGFYEVCVDNAYLQPDADHALVFTENWVLNFKPDGELFDKKSISSPLLF